MCTNNFKAFFILFFYAIDSADLIYQGRLFYVIWAATAKAWSPIHFKLDHGTATVFLFFYHFQLTCYIFSTRSSGGTVSCVWRCLMRAGHPEQACSACRWEWLLNWWVWHGTASPCITQRSMAGATWCLDAKITWTPRWKTQGVCAHTGTGHTVQLGLETWDAFSGSIAR